MSEQADIRKIFLNWVITNYYTIYHFGYRELREIFSFLPGNQILRFDFFLSKSINKLGNVPDYDKNIFPDDFFRNNEKTIQKFTFCVVPTVGVLNHPFWGFFRKIYFDSFFLEKKIYSSQINKHRTLSKLKEATLKFRQYTEYLYYNSNYVLYFLKRFSPLKSSPMLNLLSFVFYFLIIFYYYIIK